MIDRIRQDIQERLDQLLAEADKLRRALIALDPRPQSATPPREASNSAGGDKASATPSLPKSPTARTRTRAASAASAPAKTASGATKTKVLSALSHNGALTASEVANATGLGRATVSTTLSKLAKSGQIAKAQRGYRLRESPNAPGPAQGPETAANR
jgi:DNA-binding transcriptional ArsR family regulator